MILYAAREAAGIDDVVLIRLEQLYPYPARAVMEVFVRFKNADVVWCQEEPKNMGAWAFIDPNLEWTLERVGHKTRRVHYSGRAALAATATGLMSRHLKEQKQLVEDALTGKNEYS